MCERKPAGVCTVREDVQACVREWGRGQWLEAGRRCYGRGGGRCGEREAAPARLLGRTPRLLLELLGLGVMGPGLRLGKAKCSLVLKRTCDLCRA